MAKNHLLKFRVTLGQLEQVKDKAKIKGYVTLAAYLRDLALQGNDFIESKIIETNYLVKKILEVLPWEKKK